MTSGSSPSTARPTTPLRTSGLSREDPRVRPLVSAVNRGRTEALNAACRRPPERRGDPGRRRHPRWSPTSWISTQLRTPKPTAPSASCSPITDLVAASTTATTLASRFVARNAAPDQQRFSEHAVGCRRRPGAAACSVLRPLGAGLGWYDARFSAYGWEDVEFGYRLMLSRRADRRAAAWLRSQHLAHNDRFVAKFRTGLPGRRAHGGVRRDPRSRRGAACPGRGPEDAPGASAMGATGPWRRDASGLRAARDARRRRRRTASVGGRVSTSLRLVGRALAHVVLLDRVGRRVGQDGSARHSLALRVEGDCAPEPSRDVGRYRRGDRGPGGPRSRRWSRLVRRAFRDATRHGTALDIAPPRLEGGRSRSEACLARAPPTGSGARLIRHSLPTSWQCWTRHPEQRRHRRQPAGRRRRGRPLVSRGVQHDGGARGAPPREARCCGVAPRRLGGASDRPGRQRAAAARDLAGRIALRASPWRGSPASTWLPGCSWSARLCRPFGRANRSRRRCGGSSPRPSSRPRSTSWSPAPRSTPHTARARPS